MENIRLNQPIQIEPSNKPNEIWKPLTVKHHELEFERDAAKYYEASNFLEIRNQKTKKILQVTSDGRIGIYAGGTKKMLRLFPLVYYAFNPSEAPETPEDNKEYVVVPKNKDDDNHLDNLERISRGENARKIMARTKDSRKSVVCKRVKIIEVKDGFDQSLKGKQYDSYTIAEQKLGLPKRSVAASCNRGDYAGGKFKFAYVVQQLLTDEIFKEYKGIEVSNKGRVKIRDNKITRGTPITNSRYHRVGVKLTCDTKCKYYSVHVLVWQAFNSRDVSEGKVICHDESIPEEERLIGGYERNWLSDLREGTQSENIQEFHDNRTDLTPVLHIDEHRWYHSGGKAAKALVLNIGAVHGVCKGKRTHTGGEHFRYATEVEKCVLYAAVANGKYKWGDVWVNPGELDDVTDEDEGEDNCNKKVKKIKK